MKILDILLQLQYIYKALKTSDIALLLLFKNVTNYVATFATKLLIIHGTCDLLSASYYPITFYQK